MNPLLARQLRKHLPQLDPTDPAWAGFFGAVDSAYGELQQDRAFLEHTLEVTSEELTEANEKLRREADLRLASLSRYYEQTLELQQGMILCVHRTAEGFRHTLCRGQLLQRLGLKPADIEGKLIRDVAGPNQTDVLTAAYERAWTGEPVSLSFTNADGIELFALMRPRYEGGAVREIIASCIEITALKDAERELRSAKERAEAADRAKSEFLAVMSHEIRSPLNAVLGFSELLKESKLDAEQRSWVDTVCSAGTSLLALIDDILDFSKIEAGQLALHYEPVALGSLVDGVVSLFRPRAAAKGLTLSAMLAPDTPDFVTTDQHRLQQILVNLVGNAVKFTSRGSILLSVQRIPTESDPIILRFAVTDTGIGIPVDRRDRLFKPFSQVDSSTTRHYGGTGLGLAISHRLAHLLGGDIGVESEPGRGSTFFFTIRAPLAVLPKDLHLSSAAKLGAPTSSLRILVAEDQPQNRQLIASYLTSRGYRADLVENGRLAIEAVHRKAYDLILMDLLMPEADGYAATRAIREHLHGGPQPRIFALTANVMPEERERCREAGMDGMLAKPLDFKQLAQVLAGGVTGGVR